MNKFLLFFVWHLLLEFLFMTEVFIIFDIVMTFFFHLDGIYFLFHGLHNILIGFYTFPHVQNVITMQHDEAQIHPMVFSLLYGLHFYHVIKYHRRINLSEMIHHILCLLVAIPIVYIFFENRNLLGFSLFATTGWSTVIYYLSLFLSKNNIISKNRALHINFISNTFFRCPLIIFNAAYLLQYLFINKTVITDLETVCTFLLFSILMWNGLYFQYQVSFKYFQTIQI